MRNSGNVVASQPARQDPDEPCNDSGNVAKSSGMHKKDRIEKGESGETAKTIPMPCFPGRAREKSRDSGDGSLSKNPRLAMQWIKEIETAKSIDDFISPKSITGKDFPGYDELNMMMASALKKCYEKQTHFRKKVRIEEQRAQKNDRFLRWRHIALMIYDNFRSTGFYAEIQGLSGLFSISVFDWKTMLSKILTCDGSRHYYLQVINRRTTF